MNEQIEIYIEKYPRDIAEMFAKLRSIICDSVAAEVNETLWAKMPSYYVGKSFVRLIPFKDYINIEAAAAVNHREQLSEYKITPKGMLQIYTYQNVPRKVLKQIFAETLT